MPPKSNLKLYYIGEKLDVYLIVIAHFVFRKIKLLIVVISVPKEKKLTNQIKTECIIFCITTFTLHKVDFF